MINDLLTRISENVGLEPDVAEKSVGIILAFLQKNGPTNEISAMMSAIPGAHELAQACAPEGGGLIGGLMNMMGAGGGVMALGQQLMGEGVGMGQVQALAKELFAFAQEKAGEDTMGAIVGSIPGLSQFV